MKLTPADLRYAAHARCECGLGMAYRVECDMRNSEHTQWECSGVLLGTGDKDVLHTAPLPFAFYEVRSEDQPSAGRATTRPPETDAEKRSRAGAAAQRRVNALVDGVARAKAAFVAAYQEARKACDTFASDAYTDEIQVAEILIRLDSVTLDPAPLGKDGGYGLTFKREEFRNV